MTKDQFEERLYSNPGDTSPEFLAALKEDPARQQLADEIKSFNALLNDGLGAVSGPEDLRLRLMNPESLIAEADTVAPAIALQAEAANDSHFLRRLLPVAASLFLVLGIVFYYWPAQNNEFEAEIFAHLYHEIDMLGLNNNPALQDVNSQLGSKVHAQIAANSQAAGITVNTIKDCLIAQENAIHMVMQGQTGPVTVMVIPNSPVRAEFAISDTTYNGLVTPTPGGNLVVIGSKQEPIEEYQAMLSRNMEWEY